MAPWLDSTSSKEMKNEIKNEMKNEMKSWLLCVFCLLASWIYPAGALAAEPDSTVCFEGRAVNGAQQPFPGVKVVLIGTPLSTMTDGTGAFTIAGDAGSLAKSPRSLALEFTAAGCEARTLVPAVTRQRDLAVVIYQAPTAGDPVTASRFVEEVPFGATPAPIDTKALGPWMAPQTVEIEWGVADGLQNVPLSGRVEGFKSALGKIEPLEQGNGMIPAGEHHWREKPDAATSGKRRGIRLAVHLPTDPSQAMISLWTSAGNCGVRMADLDQGPILVPSLGLYITRPGSVPVQKFKSDLAARKLTTVRQLANESPEESYMSAMTRIFGENASKLPDFPQPPYEPVMQIDVPEKQLVAQWRLGAWHLQRWCRKMDDGTYQVSIWRYRPELPGDMWETPAKSRMDFETIQRKGRATCIAQESHEIIRALDVMGVHEVAEGGLNYWINARKYVNANNSGSQFTDFDGILLTDNPGAGGPGYDMHHPAGHGLIMEAAAMHYRMTDNKAWFLAAAPRLKKASEWALRQRKAWVSATPRSAWGYGLQPPINFGDYGGANLFYLVNARFYNGMFSTTKIMTELGVEGADKLMQEIGEYRQDIRAAADRSAALTPAVRSSDGTYRRFVPATPYNRSNICSTYDGIMGFACLADSDSGVYGSGDPLIKDVIDVIEGSLKDGITYQIGYEAHPRIHLLNDDIPLFLRSLYLEYASLIRPWEWEADAPGRRDTPETTVGPAAYEFFEHIGKVACDKTFEEAVFLQRVRNMLVMEIGDQLWLARATPRAWLQQGKKISVKNAPTCFGDVAYEILSDVDHGKITATVKLPSRNPPGEVRLRLRHPASAPIKSVTVNGKQWNDFDPGKEIVKLHGMKDTAIIDVSY